MNRIAGLVNFNERPIEPSILSAMLSCQGKCSLDGQNIWSGSSVGFGYQAAVDKSTSPLAPLVIGNLIVTADSRLDNRAELLAQFDLPPTSDHELIAAAYRRWGLDCPQHLLGDFSFAIWDSAANTLICATDPFGVRPLYYARTVDGLAFASDSDALLMLPGIDHALNEAAIVSYLAMFAPTPGVTLYRQIRHLPARHTLQATRNDLVLRPYWTLDPTREIRFKTDDEYEAAFLDLLREAVRCRLESPESVGALLSGGLDSSAVTGIASDLLRQADRAPLHTFYLASTSTSCDESPYVQAVVEQAHTRHHDLPYLSPLNAIGDFIDPARHLSPMLYYAASLNLFRTAQAAGVRVILTGTDGDNTVGHGRAYLAELAAAQQWDALEAELTGLCEHFGGAPGSYLHRYVLPLLRDWVESGHWGAFTRGVNALTQRWPLSRRQLIWEAALRLRLPELWLEAFHRLRGQRPTSALLPDLIRPEAQRWLIDDTPEPPALTARQEQIAGLLAGTLPANFAAYDQIAASTGVEVRHPFADRRLVEFCVALPPEQKIRQGWTRSIMRRALAGIIPDEVRWRSGKLGYGDHLIDSLHGADRAVLPALLALDTPAAQFVDLPLARQRCQQFMEQPTLRDAALLVRIARLNYWLRPA